MEFIKALAKKSGTSAESEARTTSLGMSDALKRKSENSRGDQIESVGGTSHEEQAYLDRMKELEDDF